MEIITNWTNIEFGFGWYTSHWFDHQFTGNKTKSCGAIYLLLGPWTIEFKLGHDIEVLDGPPRTAKSE